MKWILAIFVLCTSLLSCQAQKTTDLDKLSFKEDVKELLGTRKKFVENRDVATTLPSFYTNDISGFTFDGIGFSNGGENGNDDIPASSLYFLLRDTVKPYKIEGFYLDVEKQAEAKKLYSYLKKEYGEPKQISLPEISPDKKSPGVYTGASIWENYKDDRAMICATVYSTKNKKDVFAITLYVIDKSVLDKDPGSIRTVKDRLIEMYKK